MIAITTELCDTSHRGQDSKAQAGGLKMAAHPIRTNPAIPTSEWNPSSDVYQRSQLTSALRAALIALVLLGILAVIVLL